MTRRQYQSNDKLLGDNSIGSGIDQSWQQDNQAWWDWYVTLADNPNCVDERVSVQFPSLPEVDIPSEYVVESELAEPYDLTRDQCEEFRRDGFIKLKNVLSKGAVVKLRYELLRFLDKTFGASKNEDRNNRFLSLEMMWLEDTIIRSYVLSPRIAKICADLLGVKRVRLYHDNVLAKEPGCGRTPWHCDDHHFPLATNDVVTAWVPAQAIPVEMGPLAFAKPLNVAKLVQNIDFNKFDTSYDKEVSKVFSLNKVLIEDGAFEAGEVSFHHNLSYHTAAGNRTNETRVVLANTFFADGARVVDQPTMVSGDWAKFMPGVHPGEIVASELNPICWPIKTDGKS